VTVDVRDADGLALCTVRIEDAARLSSARLRDVAARAHAGLFRAAEALAARNPIRMWNFLPSILSLREHGLNTYQVFNQGRFNAFVRALGSNSAFPARLPTATAIGHNGPDLIVHCLSSAAAGIHVENPRQVPAYRYSARYGPRPPCFARGTVVRRSGSPVLLVGGTASVRNEVSMHPNDLRSQIAETFENLSALASAARAAWPAGVPGTPRLLRDGFEHLRVYYALAGCEGVLLDEVRQRVGPEPDIELVGATLCREELLVEIEGVVTL
jgi:chorismate lyase/3-hydroxybenzoate synthase